MSEGQKGIFFKLKGDMFDMDLIEWSRAQFALTAMYHWLFVPLTL